MAEIDGLLRRAELDAEKLSALIRLAVFAALAASILSTEQSYSLDTMPELTIALYGIGTAVGLVLAWCRLFHPFVPYLFVTFDVILVSILILMLSGMMGMSTSFAFALPVAGLIFIILIQRIDALSALADRLRRRSLSHCHSCGGTALRWRRSRSNAADASYGWTDGRALPRHGYHYEL